MGMITEGQILHAIERTNEILAHLYVQQQRTNQLLEALFRPAQPTPAGGADEPAG